MHLDVTVCEVWRVCMFCVYCICMNASTDTVCMCLSVCARAHACGLASYVCGCCQKKLTGDEGWRESETHWAGNGV